MIARRFISHSFEFIVPFAAIDPAD